MLPTDGFLLTPVSSLLPCLWIWPCLHGKSLGWKSTDVMLSESWALKRTLFDRGKSLRGPGHSESRGSSCPELGAHRSGFDPYLCLLFPAFPCLITLHLGVLICQIRIIVLSPSWCYCENSVKRCIALSSEETFDEC